MKRGWGLALGMICSTAGLALGRSYSHAVFGRWSTIYATVLAGAAVLALILTIRWVRSPVIAPPVGGWLRQPGFWTELAALLYGAAYLWSALDDRENASRVLDLNFTGSIVPGAVMLEWLALVAAFIGFLLLVVPLIQRHTAIMLPIVSVLAAALLLEGGARLLAVAAPEVQGFPTNRSRIWRRHFVQLNRIGVRDIDHATEAAPGVRRLLVVGDSYAMGDGLNNPADRFAARLGAAATERTGHPWEVLHYSRTDTHTLQHLELLGAGLPYHPDVVLLLYYFNDMDYLSPITERDALTAHPDNLLGRLRLDRWIFINSFAFQELYLRFRQLRHAWNRTPRPDPYADSALVARHLRDVQDFVARAREAGARVLVVPFDVAVTASDAARQRYDRFVAACEAAQLPVLSTREALGDRTLEELSVNALDRHPNEEANALLARYVLPHFLRLAEAGSGPGEGLKASR